MFVEIERKFVPCRSSLTGTAGVSLDMPCEPRAPGPPLGYLLWSHTWAAWSGCGTLWMQGPAPSEFSTNGNLFRILRFNNTIKYHVLQTYPCRTLIILFDPDYGARPGICPVKNNNVFNCEPHPPQKLTTPFPPGRSGVITHM